MILSIDAHRIGAAHAMRARATKRQRAVVMALHHLEQVQDTIRLLRFECKSLVMTSLIHFGVIAKDFECYLHFHLHEEHEGIEVNRETSKPAGRYRGMVYLFPCVLVLPANTPFPWADIS